MRTNNPKKLGNDFEAVIGLEVHVELNTKSKIFCACPSSFFGREPNSQTCPVCLGLPGALPVTNKEAIHKALMVGLALNCTISEDSYFERKNYFYPDLPKGFQISQYQKPFCTNGNLEVAGKQYRINRAHMEEDTGKLTHSGNKTLIDFNRSGVPLLEIVSEADFRDAKTARKYLEKIQELVRVLDVSEGDMEKGSLRLEANVSIQEKGRYTVGKALVEGVGDYQPNPKVELKNINSFRFVERAINFEIKRQNEALANGETLAQETRGWDEKKNCSYVQRVKEGSSDYRYFPEPDLPPMTFTKAEISKIQNKVNSLLVKLSENESTQLSETLNISEDTARLLMAIPNGPDVCTTVHNLLPEVPIEDIVNPLINRPEYRQLDAQAFARRIIESSSGIISRLEDLNPIAQKIVSNNPQSVNDYRSGKENVIQFLLGQMMKETKGKADPKAARKVLESLLGSS